ncbi:hypothetical protein Taro_002591 [Colocasia esculenta]|uniref:CCHC-type domain-containing protein n=1 Tax=Colocasia esculenta TaxID=4460 RepID=A0A843TP65_COLES|nr:hypothetical protein [Colocasia esculenta]
MCRRLFRFNDKTMATRGRRGVVLTQGDESAGGSQAPTQQAQDQTGAPLSPPPPLVDYGALMQGLVHAMKTQAQTTAALLAQRAVAPARVAAPTPGGGSVVEKPVCTQCGKRHGGEVCWVTSWRCLRCGDKNHKIRDCPKMAQQTAAIAAPAAVRPAPRTAGRPRAQARVFALARDEAELAEHGGFRTGFEGEKRGSRRGDSVPVRAVWRLLNQGGSTSFVIRSFSKQKACVGGRLERLELAGRNCLTDEAGFFGIRFDTPVGGIEASYMGVQFRI